MVLTAISINHYSRAVSINMITVKTNVVSRKRGPSAYMANLFANSFAHLWYYKLLKLQV